MDLLYTRVHSETPFHFATAGHPQAYPQRVFVAPDSQLSMLSLAKGGHRSSQQDKGLLTKVVISVLFYTVFILYCLYAFWHGLDH